MYLKVLNMAEKFQKRYHNITTLQPNGSAFYCETEENVKTPSLRLLQQEMLGIFTETIPCAMSLGEQQKGVLTTM